MKKLLFIALLFLLPLSVSAQHKADGQAVDLKGRIGTPVSESIFGLFNPEKLNMSHSLSMSYMSFGGGGMMLNSYQNTLTYQLSSPFTLRLNLGLLNSPYNSFQDNPALNSTRFFGGAALEFRPSDKTRLSIGVDYMPYYNLRYSPNSGIRD